MSRIVNATKFLFKVTSKLADMDHFPISKKFLKKFSTVNSGSSVSEKMLQGVSKGIL